MLMFIIIMVYSIISISLFFCNNLLKYLKLIYFISNFKSITAEIGWFSLQFQLSFRFHIQIGTISPLSKLTLASGFPPSMQPVFSIAFKSYGSKSIKPMLS